MKFSIYRVLILWLLAGLPSSGAPATFVAEPVADILPGGGSSDPSELANIDGVLYFAADDGNAGRELWRHNLKTKTTEIVTNLNSGSASSSPTGLVNLFGKLYFAADDGRSGRELWRHDPRSNKTELLKDINPGGASSSPEHLTVVADELFFTANDGEHGRELWERLPDSDGGATAMVKDINPDNSPNPENEVPPVELTAVNDTLFFSANDREHGYELWKVNLFASGVETGAKLVRDIAPGPDTSLASDFVSFNGKLFFTVFDPSQSPGRRLWQSDGTLVGTDIVSPDVPVLNPETGSLHTLMPVDKKLFFPGTTTLNDGAELFVTDGTGAGTTRVKDIFPDFRTSLVSQLTKVNGVLFFGARDGVFFDEPPSEGGGSGQELWRSDGTQDGTSMVKDIDPGMDSGFSNRSDPGHLTNADGILFFTANVQPEIGRELWTSDGTAAGTQLVKDIFTGINPNTRVANSSDPDHLTLVNTTLFFTADDGSRGRELWKVELPDADGDGLLDNWETSGIDYDMDGTPDLNLAELGASPNHKDVFLEIDWMARPPFSHSHRPLPESLDMVAEAFREAPVGNPDGSTGITVHLIPDEEISEVTPVSFGPLPVQAAAASFADLKRQFFGRPVDTEPRLLESRRLVFRYAIFAHQEIDFFGSVHHLGIAEAFGDDMMVTLGEQTDKWFRAAGGTSELPAAQAVVESGVLMHELGHLLGLDHGGDDGFNGKPNYLSVMNYSFTTRNLYVTRPLDYSRGALPSLDEFRLRELPGIGAVPGRNTLFTHTVFGLTDYEEDDHVRRLNGIDDDGNGIIDRYIRVHRADGPIDWNGDGLITIDRGVASNNLRDLRRRIDLNGDGIADRERIYLNVLSDRLRVLRGFNDWDNLRYNFRDSFGSHSQFQFPPDTEFPELTDDQVLAGAEAVDFDGDGISNADDNCPAVFNPNQRDSDGDGIGDACDEVQALDIDGDGVPDVNDNCPTTPNPDQADADGDGVGDICDNCPTVLNADQADTDNNGVGDPCEPPPPVDTDPPLCELLEIRRGPPAQILVRVQDTGSGLKEIRVVEAINALVSVPTISPGTSGSETVVATKIDQTQQSVVELEIVDVDANITRCDPVITILELNTGKSLTQTFTGIPKAESFVTVQNGIAGLQKLHIKVNGQQTWMIRLRDSMSTTFDVSSAMAEGDNTITLIGQGNLGASAVVVIADSGVGQQHHGHLLNRDQRHGHLHGLVWGRLVGEVESSPQR